MLKIRNIIILAFVGLIGLAGCSGKDDDLIFEGANPISRLYISTSDYVSNSSTVDYFNLFIVGASDSTTMDSLANKYTSGAQGGGIVYFSPFAGRIFQAGKNSSGVDTLIQTMSIERLKGGIQAGGTLGNRMFDRITGMVFNGLDNQLFVANAGDNNQSLYVINNPKSGSNYRKPAYIVPLDYKAGPLQLDSLDLYVVKQGVGVALYKSFVNVINSRKDTVTNVPPTYTASISGIRNIGGMSFSKRKNTLLVSDYDNNGVDGRVMVFENFMQQIPTGSLTPTRIVQGATTSIVKPTSVAIDERTDGIYFYVADPTAKKVLRFKIADDGNVAPNDVLQLEDQGVVLSPVSISLDSRGSVKIY